MTNLPNQEPQSTPRTSGNWGRILLWSGVGLTGITLVGGVGVSWWVKDRLAPLIETQLSQSLKRPLKVGKLERFTPNSVSFGKSFLPATPTDPNNFSTQGIEASFSLADLLFKRQLSLNLRLIEPTGYLEQDRVGNWLRLEIPPATPGLFTTEIKTVQVEKAYLSLVPFPLPGQKSSLPISLVVPQGKVNLADKNQRIFVDLEALFNSGGKVQVKGDGILSTGQAKLQVQIEQLNLPEIIKLVPVSGLTLSQGKLNANLGVHVQNNQLLGINGYTNLQEIRGKIQGLKGGIKGSGQLRFQGTQLKLDSLKVSLDNIPLNLGGVIQLSHPLDLNKLQLNLTAEIPSVKVETLVQTLKKELGESFTLPLTLQGELGMKTRVMGNLQKPLITGKIQAGKSIQVDRVLFKEISTEFKFDLPSSLLTIEKLTLQPIAGGIVTGKGDIKLALPSKNAPQSPNQNQTTQPAKTSPPGLIFDLQANNLPGDIFTSLYANPSLFKILQTNQINIGNINAKLKIFGVFDNLAGTVEWETPQATYPLNGRIELANKTANLQDINIRIAGGIVTANGQFNQQGWQGTLTTNNIRVNPLWQELSQLKNADQTPLFNLPPSVQLPSGVINTKIQLLGNYANKPDGITALGAGQITLEDSSGNPDRKINFQGELGLGRWRGIIETDGLKVSQFQPLINTFNPQPSPLSLPPQLQGIFQGRLNLSGQLNTLNLSTLIATASGELSLPQEQGFVNIKGELIDKKWTAIVGAKDVNLGEIQTGLISLGWIPPSLPQNILGQLQGEINLSGNLDNIRPETILADGRGQVSLRRGNGWLNVRGIVENGSWQAKLNTNGLGVSTLESIIKETAKETNFSQTFLSNLQGEILGEVDLKGKVTDLNPQSILGKGAFRLNLANQGGQISGNGSLNQGKWDAVITSHSLTLKTLEPSLIGMGILQKSLPNSLNGELQARFLLSGNGVDQEQIRLQGVSHITFPNQGGTIKSILMAKNGHWNASLESDQLQLNRFNSLLPSPPLPLSGKLKGEIDLSGSLAQLTLGAIGGRGRLSLSENPLDQKPLNTAFQWDGQRMIIQEASSPHFNAQGFIALAFPHQSLPTISQIELNVKVKQLNLANLPFSPELTQKLPLPSESEKSLPFQGILDFNGQIRGSSLTTLQTTGEVALRNFSVDQIKFDPLLSGSVQVGLKSGLNLDLKGEKDRIELALNTAFLPVSFQVKRDEMLARGQMEGDQFLLNLEQVPLELFNGVITPFTEGQKIAGKATGQLTVLGWKSLLAQGLSTPNNHWMDSLQASGKLSILSPEISYVKANQFQVNFRYNKGQAVFDNGFLTIGESKYQFMGTFAANHTPQFQGKLKVKDGHLQDILAALKYFNLSDLARGLKPPVYGLANQVQPLPVGSPEHTLFKQLQRLSEIDEILQQDQEKKATAKIPPLQELQGKFTGEIDASASLKSGIEAQFKLMGENWQWGNYKTDNIAVEGGFKEGTLTILPLRIESGDTLIGFTGQISEKSQSGQLRVKNIPLEQVANFVELPWVDVTGRLNLKATLAGTLENPQATGELSLLDGTLNREPIKKAEGGFSYNNGRLSFGGNALITESEPIELIGTLPFTLPFAKVKAESDIIDMKVNVKDEGLGVINILTPAIVWEKGKGNVQLRVHGTLKNPIAEGSAQVENATLKARAFPEPLTGLTGTIKFAGDRINIEGLNGSFSQGKISAKGVIPLAEPFLPNDPDLANPINFNFEQLALNLKGVYRGGVDGLLEVRGTALNPKMGGEIKLYNGQVYLGSTGAKSGSSSDTKDGENSYFDLEFNNLRINVAKGTRITNLPVLAFVGQGDLTINGSINNLQPQGSIRLITGAVNLFTTQFRLAGGYTQTATFLPSQGLDPNLDVRLITSVPEVSRYRRPSTALASEIDDPITDVSASRTVRINALVKGPASQLENNLVLTSSPSRSKEEIIALLGRTVVGDLGSQPGAFALANVAGASLFNNLESVIIQSTGLTEFRLFPTQISRTSPSSQQDSSPRATSLGLGLEVGTDLTHNLSFSILKILTTTQVPEYNLRYRINDNILLRGTTNFQNENRGSIEYEIRF